MSADALPPEEDQQALDTAPDTGTSQQDDAPFNINDIADENVRAEVERYNRQIQADYTRKTQSLADERRYVEQTRQEAEAWRALQSDPAMQAQVLQQLAEQQGYALPDPEEEDVYADPTEQLAARLDAIEQQMANQTQAATQDAQVQHIAGRAETDIAQLGQFTEAEVAAIVNTAASMPARDDGYLDVEGANQALEAAFTARQERYKQTKRAQAAPRAGVAGQKQVDLSDPEARAAHMLAIVQAGVGDD